MDQDTAADTLNVYTIGHSNHTFEQFVALLAGCGITVLVDVRSSPRASYTPHFDQQALRDGVTAQGVRYVYLGQALGGRPSSPGLYDDDGRVLYAAVAATEAFQAALGRLLAGLAGQRVALLCSEENPTGCHRRLLVGRVLGQRGVRVWHIRGDGRVESEDELVRQEQAARHGQLALFGDEETGAWRSTRSVSPKSRRSSSSAS